MKGLHLFHKFLRGIAEGVPAEIDVLIRGELAGTVEIFFEGAVQRCEVGEIRWIAIPTDAEPEEPAPAMLLTEPVATTTAPPPTTTPASTTPSTTASTTVARTDAPTSTEMAAVGIDENGSQNTGTWFFIASVAAVLGLGVFVAFRARSARKTNEAAG